MRTLREICDSIEVRTEPPYNQGGMLAAIEQWIAQRRGFSVSLRQLEDAEAKGLPPGMPLWIVELYQQYEGQRFFTGSGHPMMLWPAFVELATRFEHIEKSLGSAASSAGAKPSAPREPRARFDIDARLLAADEHHSLCAWQAPTRGFCNCNASENSYLVPAYSKLDLVRALCQLRGRGDARMRELGFAEICALMGEDPTPARPNAGPPVIPIEGTSLGARFAEHLSRVRFCGQCLVGGVKSPALYVASDAEGLEWYECGEHFPDDNVAGVTRTKLTPLAQWCEENDISGEQSPTNNVGIHEMLERALGKEVEQVFLGEFGAPIGAALQVTEESDAAIELEDAIIGPPPSDATAGAALKRRARQLLHPERKAHACGFGCGVQHEATSRGDCWNCGELCPECQPSAAQPRCVHGRLLCDAPQCQKPNRVRGLPTHQPDTVVNRIAASLAPETLEVPRGVGAPGCPQDAPAEGATESVPCPAAFARGQGAPEQGDASELGASAERGGESCR